ncbi:MAG TPA: potassium channel family protein [Actinomycetospora sp.]|uniref:potassium channel family protein n=1 Tax=Actinomycetospora sp. TaxID=1872135 RepID=UPI002F405CD2
MSSPSSNIPVSAPSRRRRILVGVRAASTVVLLVALYYLLPLSTRPGGMTLVTLVLGLVLIAALIVWQLRAIVHARHPGLRAVETLAVVIPTFLLMFAAGYFVASEAQPAAFSEVLTRTGALYFTITVFATVGFGDISPVSDGTRIVVCLQMLLDLLLLGIVLQAILGAVRRGQARAASTEE